MAESFAHRDSGSEVDLASPITNIILHSSSAVEFFKLFITDDFVTKMAEQTNFYAVQRGAPRSFRPVSDGVINLYLYNFGSNLRVAFVERPSNLWVKRP